MHNTTNRLQNVFGYFTTIASSIALAVALVSLVSAPNVGGLGEGTLALRDVQVVKGRPYYYSAKREEYAHIKFDLDIDLSNLFTWNTKQVFLYITATYPTTPNHPPTKSIIWDAILPHPLSPAHPNQYTHHRPHKVGRTSKQDPAHKTASTPHVPGILQLSSQSPKYQITDPTGRLAGRANATLELGWNVQPWVGMLTWGTADPSPYGARVRTPFWYRVLPGFLATWRGFPGGGGRSGAFEMPGIREKGEAERKGGLGTERGGEGNRGSPA